MKKLLFINQSLGIGGAETFNKGLFTWLKKQNISITAFVTNKTFQKDLNACGVKTKHIPIIVDIIGNWKGFLKGIILLPLAFAYYAILVLNNKNTDIIIMSGFIEKIFVTPIARLLKIPVIWIEFSSLTAVFSKFFGFPKFLYSLVQNLPDKIIVPSEYTLCSLEAETKLNRSKFLLISCAEDIDYKKYSNIFSGNNSVCCVSRLEKGKGQDLLLKAWVEVSKKILSAALTIVGEGGFQGELTKLARYLDLEDSVIFTGYIKDSLSEIAKAEIFIFPTMWPLEGFGLVAIEAMALSKPVICFNFGPVPEIVDETTGIVIEKGNTDKMAEAIIKLLKNKKLSRKLGVSGRKKYLREFTFDKIGPKYLSVLKGVSLPKQGDSL